MIKNIKQFNSEIYKMTLQEVLKLAKQLTSLDKVRLIQQLTPDLEKELAQQNRTLKDHY